MRCPSCGHQARDDAAFCGECGARLGTRVRCAHCGVTNPAGQRFCSACGERVEGGADVETTITRGPVSFADGRYEVERFLGEGAHKRVYLARDTTLDRSVAFAVIKSESPSAELGERIRREARSMGRLPADPNLVTVYDAGDDGGLPYIVQEFVDGGTVDDLLRHSAGKPLPLEQALRIAAGVCRALERAHLNGIVHRDLKPANVWLTIDGTPKLGDFGLVAAMRGAHGETVDKLTGEGMMVGTLAYMAPEQALGRQPDPRSDLYSLGAMLYELVTGQRPFTAGDAQALVSAHLRTPAPAPAMHNPDLPRPLSELILNLLAKDPRERPANAGSVRAALESIAASLGSSAAEPAAETLAALGGDSYVGREHEVEELCAAVDEAIGGRGQVVLIAGEPGIGKTRLAEQVAVYAQMREAVVLWGSCYEGEGAPPYWPWVQIIRTYAVDHDPRVLAEVMGVGAADIAQLVSEVGRRLPDIAAPPALGAEQERFRLFDSVTRFLVNAARDQPLIIVLDDMHCADRSSLLLLEFLAHEVPRARLLVLVTYRDVELHPAHSLTHTLAQLARVHPPRRIVLHGLSRPEVARYLQMSAGAEPSESLVSAVLDKSEGNPFFVSEIVRLLGADERREDGEPKSLGHVGIPSEVRELIGRRVEPLSEPCRSALTAAAVIGRDFTLRWLQRVVDVPAARLLEAIEEAAAAHVIAEVAPGAYRFSHVLICDTLAGGLPAAERMRLHHEIGAAIEEVSAARLAPHVNELAHHYLEAAPAGDLDKALHYATAAAEHAGARFAHDEAATLYARALAALDLAPADDSRRCDLLLRLGEAHAHAGATAQAQSEFRQAADLARRLSSPQRVARAALGFGGPRASFGVVDAVLVGLLQEALAESGHEDPEWRVRVLARLAMELTYSHEQERRAELVEEALALARELGDPATLGYALNARLAVLWGSASALQRLAIADEVIELADAAGDQLLSCEGRTHRATALLELGDVSAAVAEIGAHARLAESLRQPLALWQATAWRSMLALLSGRMTEGLAHAEEAFALGQRVRATDAEHCYAIQRLIAASSLGGLEHLLETFQQLSVQFPATRWRDAGLTFVFAELGRRDEAVTAFEAVASRGFETLPRDAQWLVSVGALADACGFVDDARRADELYALLRPHAGTSILMPDAWGCFGSVDRTLGVLATTQRRWDSAEAHFEAALALDERMGARTWLVRTQLGYAQMLLIQGDRERAHGLLTEAAASVGELGLTGLAPRVEAQLAAAVR